MVFQSEKPTISFPDVSVYEMLFENIKKNVADRPCFIDADDPDKSITFAEMKELILRFGAGLKHIAPDFSAGDVIAIYSPNNIYYPAIVHGTVAAGGIIASIDHSSDSATAASCLKTIKAKIIITHSENLNKAVQAAKIVGISTKSIFTLTKEKNANNDVQSVHDIFWAHDKTCTPIKRTIEELSISPSYLYFTSGTTGKKKAVAITQKAIVHALFTRIPPTSSHLKILTHNEFHHFSNLLGNMHLNILGGYTTYIFKNMVFDKYFRAIQDHKINVIQIPPWLAAKMVKEDLFVDQYDFSSLISVKSTGTASNKAILKAFHQRFNVPIINFYGMTEIMSCFVTDFEKSLKGSVGVLEAGYTSKLINSEGKELGHNEIGELCVKGPTIMLGYYNNPDSSASAFDTDGFFRTGDLFQVNKDGEFTHVERLSDVIRYRYNMIPPQDIENVVLSHPLVISCAVVGCFSKIENEYLITAFVVLKKSSKDVDKVKIEILGITKTGLPDLKQIRGGLYVIDDIPKTNTGKIDRRALRRYEADVPIK